MTDNTLRDTQKQLPNYIALYSALQQAQLPVTPAELHGLLTGMLCGGLSLADKGWQPLLFDYSNEGMGWPTKALGEAEGLLSFTADELNAAGFELSLLLPDDATLVEMADALSEWVNHFISGLGLVSVKLAGISSDAKEALGDLEEISKLAIDEADDMAEQAILFEQVVEHVKVCCLTLHTALASPSISQPTKPTLH